jgi:hypothetical protein
MNNAFQNDERSFHAGRSKTGSKMGGSSVGSSAAFHGHSF